MSSRLARLIHKHQDQNATTDFHSASATSSFQAAPTPGNLEAAPTRRDLLCPAIASLVSVRLEPSSSVQLLICVVTDVTGSPSQPDPIAHKKLGTSKLPGSCPRASLPPQKLPSRVSKSRPVSREIRSVRPPLQLTRGQELALSHVADLGQICMSGFICRQLINLVHEELFSTLPQHRSLLLIHRLHVALDVAVVFRCRTIACRCPTRFAMSASSSSGSNFVVCPVQLSSCVSSSPTETLPVTRATRNFFSCGDRCSSVLHDCQHRPLAVLFCRGHIPPLVRLPSVSSEVLGCLVVAVLALLVPL